MYVRAAPLSRAVASLASAIIPATRAAGGALDAGAAGRQLILSTCWPLDAKFSGPLRYLVQAEILDGGG